MNKPNAPETDFWSHAAGLAPVLIASRDLPSGIAMAGGFLLAYASALTTALFLPRSMRGKLSFLTSCMVAVLVLTLYASLVRAIDAMLFEKLSTFLFLIPFLPPVYVAAATQGTEANRERAWEQALMALALAVFVAVFSVVRELVASGSLTLFGTSGGRSILPSMAHPAGALLTLAIGFAFARHIRSLISRKSR
ncbi:MAG TPA: Rnf-Nqr domain containing protein [Spirochaetales bacterium]|nr:Rnf-Nqr domain containing protein [Spirochaetales bacterium]